METWEKFYCAAGAGLAVCVLATMLHVGTAFAEAKNRRTELEAARVRSPAHDFVVSRWLDCNWVVTNRTECYSAIRTVAQSHGSTFTTNVDAAARELGII